MWALVGEMARDSSMSPTLCGPWWSDGYVGLETVPCHQRYVGLGGEMARDSSMSPTLCGPWWSDG